MYLLVLEAVSAERNGFVTAQEFERSMSSHQAVVNKLIESGTYLRQFGCKDRLVDVDSTLRDVHTHWKQLIYDAEVHGRRLIIACRDDKRVCVCVCVCVRRTRLYLPKGFATRGFGCRVTELVSLGFGFRGFTVQGSRSCRFMVWRSGAEFVGLRFGLPGPVGVWFWGCRTRMFGFRV